MLIAASLVYSLLLSWSVPILIRTIGMSFETLTNDRRTGKRNTRGN
jgi:hypothetical protein